MKRNAKNAKSSRIKIGDFGNNDIASTKSNTIPSTRNKTTTRSGRFGFSNNTINGSVKNMATKNEASSVLDTTIGIGFINSPIIPVDNNSGKNAHTVVIV